jgi:hypothetical protein
MRCDMRPAASWHRGGFNMRTLAQSIVIDSVFGVEQELPHAGSELENAYVYDSSARELKAMADRGLIEVIEEQSRVVNNEALIGRLSFRRLR